MREGENINQNMARTETGLQLNRGDFLELVPGFGQILAAWRARSVDPRRWSKYGQVGLAGEVAVVGATGVVRFIDLLSESLRDHSLEISPELLAAFPDPRAAEDMIRVVHQRFTSVFGQKVGTVTFAPLTGRYQVTGENIPVIERANSGFVEIHPGLIQQYGGDTWLALLGHVIAHAETHAQRGETRSITDKYPNLVINGQRIVEFKGLMPLYYDDEGSLVGLTAIEENQAEANAIYLNPPDVFYPNVNPPLTRAGRFALELAETHGGMIEVEHLLQDGLLEQYVARVVEKPAGGLESQDFQQVYDTHVLVLAGRARP